MAVMEHAYYASFGYQVTSFFAASRYISLLIYSLPLIILLVITIVIIIIVYYKSCRTQLTGE